MKILHVSDLHSNLKWYAWLRREAACYDLTCITGDLIGRARDPNIGKQVDEVCAYLADFPTPLAICTGNHDYLKLPLGGPCDWFRRMKGTRVRTDGARFPFGKRFVRCIAWGDRLPSAGPDDIWLYHCPPRGSRTAIARMERVDFGDHELAALCRAGKGPAIVLCGHMHDPWEHADRVGRTLVLNPGFDDGAPLPTHHVIDFDRATVEFRQAGSYARETALLANDSDQ